MFWLKACLYLSWESYFTPMTLKQLLSWVPELLMEKEQVPLFSYLKETISVTLSANTTN